MAVETTTRKRVPPVRCLPWCVTTANGYADAWHREDQLCASEDTEIPMSRAAMVELADGSWREDYTVVNAQRDYGQSPIVQLGQGEEPRMEFTPGEAIKLAAALLAAVAIAGAPPMESSVLLLKGDSFGTTGAPPSPSPRSAQMVDGVTAEIFAAAVHDLRPSGLPEIRPSS